MRTPWTAALVFLVGMGATGAEAQESRAELLRQARDEKQKQLQPYHPNVLESTLKMVERQGVPLITRDGIYVKLGSLTIGSGFAAGLGFRNRRLLDRDGSLDLWFGGSVSGYWAAEGRLRFPSLAGGHVMAEGFARRHEYPGEDFFGIGPAAGTRIQADFSQLINTAGARAGVRLLPTVTVGGGLEYIEPRIANGRDDRVPGIRDLFDESSVPGLARQPDYWRPLAFVDVDWRRPLNARKGGWYRAEYSHYEDRDHGAYSFRRLDVDVRQWISVLSERRVLFGRVMAATSDADPGHRVPFYLMPTLGGNDSLRGFRDYRFRGPHALLLQGEYRFEIWSGLDAALFYDAGKVALRRSDLSLHDLESDYGVGFRFNTDNGMVLRVDGAFGSRDGKHLWVVWGGRF